MKSFFIALLTFSSFFGVKSQVKDTLASREIHNNGFEFAPKKLYVPAGLMVGGLLTDLGKNSSIEKEIVEERNEHLFGFTNHIDDYAQFAPFVAL